MLQAGKKNMWAVGALRPYLGRMKDFRGSLPVLNLASGMSNSDRLYAGTRLHLIGDPSTANSIGYHLKSTARILIVSPPSTGKSVALLALSRHISLGSAHPLPEKIENRIPIHLDCQTVDREFLKPGSSLSAYAGNLARMLQPGSTEETITHVEAWAESGDFVLMVDGLDLLSPPELATVFKWAKESPSATVLFTTSKAIVSQALDDFKVMEIEGLRPADIADYTSHVVLSTLGVGKEDQTPKLLRAIKADPTNAELSKSSFWLNMMLNLLIVDGRLPVGKLAIMRAFFEAALGRSRTLHRCVTDTDYLLLIEWLGEAAWNLALGAGKGKAITLSGNDLKARLIQLMVESRRSYKDESRFAEAAFKWVTDSTCILRRTTGDNYIFNGQSIHHFFASHYLCHKVATPAFVLKQKSAFITAKKLANLSRNQKMIPILEMMLEQLEDRYSSEWPKQIVDLCFTDTASDFYQEVASRWSVTAGPVI